MKRRMVFLAALAGIIVASCSHEIRIACIGDSITEGAGIDYQSRSSYPVMLDSILGPGYSVLNCGRSGATMLKRSDLPYWKCNEMYNAFAFRPDVVVIALGTNDSKIHNWDAAAYESDFQSMLDTLKTLTPAPSVFVCLPPPAFRMAWSIDDSVITNGVIPIIERLKEKNTFRLIDLNHTLRNQPGLFPDGIHPDAGGARVLAAIVAEELKK